MSSDLAPRALVDRLAARAARRARTDELADQIAVCAARIDAATHHLLTLIRTFDLEKGWAAQGSKTCAEWLSWRIGLGPEAAREKVRIALALGGLPHIDAALERGQLSYTKVRAMTRVATPDNEDLLLAQARGTTGAELERICSGFRRVVHGRATDEERRYVRRRTLHDGSVQIELRLLPDEAELVWKAIAAARDVLRAERDSAEPAEARSSSAPSSTAELPPSEHASAKSVEAPTMGMPPVDATASFVVSAEPGEAPTMQMPPVDACLAAAACLAAPTSGVPSVDATASFVVSAESAEAAMMQPVDACPRAVVSAERSPTSCSQARATGSAESSETPCASEAARGFAAPTQGRAPGASLADGVVAVAEAWLATGGRLAGRPGAERHTIFVHLTERDLSARGKPAGTAASEPARKAAGTAGNEPASASATLATSSTSSSASANGAPSDPATDWTTRPWKAELFDGVALSGETLLRLACDAGLVAAKTDARGSVLDLGRRRRTVSPALRRALVLRDRGCRFPGCRHRAFVDAHHIEHWAHGGSTALDNTVLLCHRHHVLLHEGGFGVRRERDSFRFVDPDGRTLEPNPKPPAAGGLRDIEIDHEARGIWIDERTALPRRPAQVEVAGCVRALVALHAWE